MSPIVEIDRRRFLSAALATLAVPQLAVNRAESVPLGTLKQVAAGVLNVGYAEAGSPNGQPVILLHGWPYDIHSFVDVVPLLASAGYRVLWPERCKGIVAVSGYLIANREANRQALPPQAEYAWWYQYYFATERGERGYSEYRREFSELIWRLASPKWQFDKASDVRPRRPIVRQPGSRQDRDPQLSVASRAGGRRAEVRPARSGACRDVTGGIGHNLPQEAPHAFANAVIDVDRRPRSMQ